MSAEEAKGGRLTLGPSIYQRALGAEFQRLHPQMQRRFGLSADAGIASIGTGVMEDLWHGAAYTLPFLYVGTWRRIMFPERGRSVPFTIENYAYRDPLGRETVSWVRTFETTKRRRFDAYMIWSEQRGRIVDYLGTHQHLAVDCEVASSGSTKEWSGSGSPCSSRALRTSVSGTTTMRDAFEFASTWRISGGGRCSGIPEASRWNGVRSATAASQQ